MAISDVQLKNNYYQVFDGSGKKIKESHSSSVGELCGIGMDFMVFLKNKYFAVHYRQVFLQAELMKYH